MKRKNRGSRKHPKKCNPRLKSTWVRDKKGIPQQYIAPKDMDDMKLKESAKVMAEAFPNSNIHITEPVKNGLTPAQTKRSEMKPKAPVYCINAKREEKGLKPITTPQQIQHTRSVQKFVHEEASVYRKWASRKDWWVSKKLENAMDTLEIRLHMTNQLGHWKKEQQQVGPPKPDAVQSKTIGYGFANKKPVVKTHEAPSGLPMSEFLEGGKYPPKKADVTQCNKAANDDSRTDTGLRKYNGSGCADREWYRNHIPEEYTPDIVHEYDQLEYDLSKKILEWAEVVEDNAELREEVERLKDENHLMKTELNFAYWEISIDRGEQVDPPSIQEMRRGKASQVKSLSTKELANLFNVYKVQVRDNILHQFCVYHDLSIEREKEIRQHFDMECDNRIKVSEDRAWCRRMSARSKLYTTPRKAVRVMKEIRSLRSVGNKAGYGAWLQQHAPSKEYVTQCNLRSAKRFIRSERKVYAGWSLANRHSDSNKRINNRVAVIQAQIDQHDLDLMKTKKYKFLKAAKDIYNIEINPWERARIKGEQRHKSALIAKQKKADKIKASRIKREREDKLEADILRERIREAQRLAH